MFHVNAPVTQLKRANAMLYKVRDFVNANILKSIYYALFESHINYVFASRGYKTSVNSPSLHSSEKGT